MAIPDSFPESGIRLPEEIVKPLSAKVHADFSSGLPDSDAFVALFPDDAAIRLLAKTSSTLDADTRSKIDAIISCVDALSKLPESKQLTYSEKLSLAYFVVVKLAKLAETGKVYFKKTEYALPTSVVYEPELKEAYLLTKGQIQEGAKPGSKKITSAVALLLSEQSHAARFVAQATPASDVKEFLSFDAGFENPLKRDANIHKELNGMPGIWRLHTFFEYLHQKTGIQSLSIISALAEGNLASLIGPIPLQKLLPIAKVLLQGVASLHAAGYIHGDLKLQNALYCGSTVGLIDFGNAFKPASEKDPAFIVSQGMYGSDKYSAPELYLTRGFSGDFFKLDMWALGVMLYTLRFGKLPDFTKYVQRDNEDASLKEKMLAQHAEEVEKPILALDAKTSLTQEERFDRFLYQLLRADPAKRLDINAAMTEWQHISS